MATSFSFLGGAEVALAQVSAGPLLQSELPLDYDRGRNTSVLERERPEYEAMGEQVGAFRLNGRLQASAGYSTNVYGIDTNKVGDGFVGIDPSLSLSSEWSQHYVGLSLNSQIRRFFDETPKNETGLGARIDSRLDVTRTTQIFAGGGIQRAYEQISSSGFPSDARNPVEYIYSHAHARLSRSTGRIRLTGQADWRDYNFEDVRAFDSSLIDQDYRDRRDLRGIGQAEYAITPDTGVFVQLAYTDIKYDRPLAVGVPNRDANEWRILGGVSLDLTAVIRGRFGVGYVRREFDSAIYDTVDGIALDGRLEYFPSELTTFTLSGRRLIGEATIPGSNAFILSGVTLRVDHELKRNLLLNAQIDYEYDNYESITRRDKIFGVGAGANYFVSRHIGFGLNGSYLNRRSSGAFSASDFDEVRGSVSVVFQI